MMWNNMEPVQQPVNLPVKKTGLGLKIAACSGILAVIAFLAWKLRGKEESDEAETESKREIADDERKRIMQELGRKGAKRSAEVRRAKKLQDVMVEHGD